MLLTVTSAWTVVY